MKHKIFKDTIKALLILVVLTAANVYAQAGINGICIKFDDLNTATLTGEDGLIIVTTNRGVEWSYQNSGITNKLNSYFRFGKIRLIAAENGIILRTDDYEKKWYWLQSGTYEKLNDIELLSNGRAFACGDSGKILISENWGKTWFQTGANEIHSLSDIKFINNEIGFISGDFGTILKTTNGGNNWQDISINSLNSRLNAIEVIDEQFLAAVGDSGRVYISVNGGSSWNLTVLNGEANLNDISFLNAATGIIAGDNNLVYKTTDGGISWSQASVSNSNINDDFYSIAFADANFGIIAGSSTGIGVFTTDGGSSWSELNFVILNSREKLKKFNENTVTLGQNFPNPFNPTTRISYDIPFDANVSIKIYDITGREVAALVSGKQQAGLHTVDFDASGLSSGVYFYTLNTENGIEKISKVMKMILTK